jgi:hypothetical protein
MGCYAGVDDGVDVDIRTPEEIRKQELEKKRKEQIWSVHFAYWHRYSMAKFYGRCPMEEIPKNCPCDDCV